MAIRRRVERRPRARLDILEQAIYLGEQATEDVALRFLDAIAAAVQRLADKPDVGRLREFSNERLAGLRSWPVPGFPDHLIFYRAHETVVEIVRVLHGARDLLRVLDLDEEDP
jgi:plasmid stabilization system protein ParE